MMGGPLVAKADQYAVLGAIPRVVIVIAITRKEPRTATRTVLPVMANVSSNIE
jgi:hypothetical protein